MAFGALILCLVVAIVSTPTAAITFHLAPGGTRCFTEELGTLHRVQLFYRMAKSHAAFVSVSITSSDKVIIFQQKTAEKEYAHYFHPIKAGEHAVCFTSVEKASKSASDFSVVFSLLPEYEVDSQKPHDYVAASGTKENDLNRPLMNQAQYIEQNLEALHNEYKYLKQREARMRTTTETVNSRTAWVTILTIIVVGGIRLLHHYTLKRYLKAKKFLD
jgi:hypothetical protein